MPNIEIEEFARILVQHVRDSAIRSCDANLSPTMRSPTAERWRQSTSPRRGTLSNVMIPDCVDETIFHLLHAIDQGLLRLKFISSSGKEVDLTAEGLGELSGWFMGSGGWRSTFSEERFADDFSDLDPSQ